MRRSNYTTASSLTIHLTTCIPLSLQKAALSHFAANATFSKKATLSKKPKATFNKKKTSLLDKNAAQDNSEDDHGDDDDDSVDMSTWTAEERAAFNKSCVKIVLGFRLQQ